MQLNFLWGKSEEPPPPQMLELDSARSVPLVFQRNDRARRYLLRLRADGVARVTIPRRGSVRQARLFVNEHKSWLLQQLLKWEARPKVAREWTTGTEFLFRGEMVRLELHADGRVATFGPERIALRADSPVRKQVESRLLRLAQVEFPSLVFAFARQHECFISHVSVRNQRSRWGSCSVRGTISLNWRLIQAPPAVRDYVILHELMHTKEMNHSRRFWARVAEVCPDYKNHERWLTAQGPILTRG